MNDTATSRGLDAIRRTATRPATVLLAAVVLAELALVVGYLGLTGASTSSVRYLIYPFVWIDLALWAVFAVDASSTSALARRGALAVAGAYLLVLAVAGGVLDVAALSGHSHATGVDLSVFTALPPGWGPTVVFETPRATVRLVPYQFVGYLALAYLTYAAVVDAAASALSGAVGLLSCASCSWPVFASLLAAVLGGEAVARELYAYSLDLSTVAFVVAVVLLAWRPGAR
ncbi:hypothetical protein G9C85_06960 [Halorubellus sp. JP-L1]|uniref:DUF7546 family protein n=1 Tax=Halorubellus sp. JP-L1 TaxID=2715753 RepID=UPI0014077182|nr:hypothetical protein [Halorubellus sp. JP-L1]NHN41377.1 hypothetical protein [Halorubellus sp. JP-L1]